MTKSKARGTAFESSIVPLLAAFYPGAERRAMQGALDKGDFIMPNNNLFILEAKNCARLDLPGWMREAKVEAKNAGVPVGVVVHKRKGKTDPELQWVTLELYDFLQLTCRDG